MNQQRSSAKSAPLTHAPRPASNDASTVCWLRWWLCSCGAGYPWTSSTSSTTTSRDSSTNGTTLCWPSFCPTLWPSVRRAVIRYCTRGWTRIFGKSSRLFCRVVTDAGDPDGAAKLGSDKKAAPAMPTPRWSKFYLSKFFTTTWRHKFIRT